MQFSMKAMDSEAKHGDMEDTQGDEAVVIGASWEFSTSRRMMMRKRMNEDSR